MQCAVTAIQDKLLKSVVALVEQQKIKAMKARRAMKAKDVEKKKAANLPLKPGKWIRKKAKKKKGKLTGVRPEPREKMTDIFLHPFDP